MKKSELILNADGSIYHLKLFPGDIAQNIIIVGDQDRVPLVSRHFDEVTTKKQCREFVTHTGMMKGKRITVMSTGIGTDNIDVVFNELQALYLMPGGEELPKPLRLIRLGTSGAVRPEIPIDSILISTAALGMDGLLHFYEKYQEPEDLKQLLQNSEKWQSMPRPYLAYGSKFLEDHFEALQPARGITLTAPGFYAPQGRSVNTPARTPDFIELLGRSEVGGIPITNLEMETAGIYGLAEIFGFEAISISAILANRATGEFSAAPERIVEDMIVRSLELVLEL